jgi:hypothetical protein
MLCLCVLFLAPENKFHTHFWLFLFFEVLPCQFFFFKIQQKINQKTSKVYQICYKSIKTKRYFKIDIILILYFIKRNIFFYQVKQKNTKFSVTLKKCVKVKQQKSKHYIYYFISKLKSEKIKKILKIIANLMFFLVSCYTLKKKIYKKKLEYCRFTILRQKKLC